MPDEYGPLERCRPHDNASTAVDVVAPKPANEYRLTTDGVKVAAAAKARQNVSDEFDALREKADEVDDLKTEVWQLQQQVDELDKWLGIVIDHIKEKEKEQAAQ